MLSIAKTNPEQKPIVDQDYLRWPVYFTQLLSYPLYLSIKYFFLRKNIQQNLVLKPNSKIKVSHVVYSNHQSMFDPFIICASLPLRITSRLFPCRILVSNKYLTNLIGAFFIKLYGGFPAYPIQNQLYGLDKAKSVLASNQTVLIFPTGMRTKERVAKRGIAVLANEPNVHLVPVYLNWKNRFTCQVIVGSAFKCNKPQTPEELMEIVYALDKETSKK